MDSWQMVCTCFPSVVMNALFKQEAGSNPARVMSYGGDGCF
jgi:hypothetical protein